MEAAGDLPPRPAPKRVHRTKHRSRRGEKECKLATPCFLQAALHLPACAPIRIRMGATGRLPASRHPIALSRRGCAGGARRGRPDTPRASAFPRRTGHLAPALQRALVPLLPASRASPGRAAVAPSPREAEGRPAPLQPHPRLAQPRRLRARPGWSPGAHTLFSICFTMLAAEVGPATARSDGSGCTEPD